ncbi:SMI1/KNR4 family protein [Pimelobacter simplex]|uniref:SMI1/KNR4 family protein n=1 Tax=Nocardioides simplex TaxID=2045 RepID=A0A0A1DR12_NOCSI|nr:SMI1/KNR4 family protein [Pimelobacter simplex]AIY19002.1 hypothetical protein KR76_23505 [Pimelobacter simplex]MCG8148968.1 SMI1/KNR4 family protein [Pimelobacter simplex]GEB14777.1 hypothetical protein NSI01_30920 [Pimelobacter simplex]SFM25462.1 hypothetical protein SAMN05421671_0637 [Pimelobacter simplex]
MALDDDLVARIARAVTTYGAGRPIPPDELAARLAPLGLTPDPDLADFAARWGGCFVGVAVHLWDHAGLLGRETCLEMTTWARETHGAVIDGLVIADDGAGNPIWIAADGPVRMLDHDSGRVDALAPDFRTFVAENVHDWQD